MKSLTKIISGIASAAALAIPAGSNAKTPEKERYHLTPSSEFLEPESKPWNSIAKASFGMGATFNGEALFDARFDALDTKLKKNPFFSFKGKGEKTMLHASFSTDMTPRRLETAFRAEAAYLMELKLSDDSFYEHPMRFRRMSLDAGLVAGITGKLAKEDYLAVYAGTRHGLGGIQENGPDDFFGRSRNGYIYLDFPVVGLLMDSKKRAGMGGRVTSRFEHLLPESKSWGHGITFDVSMLYAGNRTIFDEEGSYYVKHIFAKKRAMLENAHFGVRFHLLKDEEWQYGLTTFVGFEG